MVMRRHGILPDPVDRLEAGLHISMPGLVTASFLEQVSSVMPLPERAYDLPTRSVHVHGTDLHYFEFGSGEPVVFVHGSIGDYRTWSNQFEPFSARYKVIAYSRRYHYPNPWVGDGTDYTTRRHADDLSAFIEAIDLGPVHLIGQSTGATIATLCASSTPELIHTLTVNEPDIIPWLLEMDGGQEQFDELVARVDMPSSKAMAEGNFELCMKTFVDGVVGTGTFDSLSSEMRAVILDNVPELKAEFLSAASYYSPFTEQDAKRIAVPTLLVEGEASLPLYLRISARLGQVLPNARRVTIPGAPHAAHTIAPDAFNHAVLAFLSRHPLSRRGQDR